MQCAVVFLLVVSVAFGVERVECPNHCFCYKWEGLVKTDCGRRNLLNTFLRISPRTQILDLSHNVIAILHGNEFLDANLKQLLRLDLSNNRLRKIDRFSFNGLALLRNLDLSHNFIEYLNPWTFENNPDLRTLDLSFNPLALKKDEPLLSSVPSLEVLDVSDCRLDFLPSRAFSGLANLSVLNISRNHITQLQFLEEMKGLTYLDLSKNELPCNDRIKAQLRSLAERRIRFAGLCGTNQTAPAKETTERTKPEMRPSQRGQEVVTHRGMEQRSIVNDAAIFFHSIPSFYAIVCGVQVGIFIGSLTTYFCLKKSPRRKAEAERETMRGEEPDNPTLALIPLNTPPGSPPSPYRSRFFPSTFSLPAT